MEQNIESKKIIFITTYKARDFEGQALVGWYLKKHHNINSYYINGYDIWKKILEIKPVMVVLDHLTWDHKKELVRYCKNLGIKTVLLFTEGYYKDIESLNQIAGSPVMEELGVDAYFAWNTSMINQAAKLTNIEFSKNFKLTGCPRFDYLANDTLKKINISKGDFKNKYGIEAYSTIITYMSTSPYQGYSFDVFEKRYRVHAGMSESDINHFYKESQLLFKNHVTVIRNIALKNPEVCFLYKTHPSEAYVSNYDVYFKDVPNVKLIINENVRPFLLYSDLIVQRNCTTALEAWIAKKPVVQLNDSEDYSEAYTEHNDYSFCVTSENELNELISNKKYLIQKRDKLDQFLEGIFYKLDGKAYLRVSKEIIEIIESVDATQIKNLQSKIGYYIIQDDNRLPNKIKDTLGLKRDFSLRPKVYFKRLFSGKKIKNTDNEVSISEDEVNAFYKKLDNIFEEA